MLLYWICKRFHWEAHCTLCMCVCVCMCIHVCMYVYEHVRVCIHDVDMYEGSRNDGIS